MQNGTNIFKKVKFLKNIAKIDINKKFIIEHNLKIKNNGPVEFNAKHKLQQLLCQNENQNEEFKKFISKANIITEALKINKGIVSIFFSTPLEAKATSKTTTFAAGTSKIAIVAKFTNLNALKLFCCNTIHTYKKIWLSSKLFDFNKPKLILIVRAKKEAENNLSALLTEFGATIEKGKFQEAIAQEHCHQIFEKYAIEKISLID